MNQKIREYEAGKIWSKDLKASDGYIDETILLTACLVPTSWASLLNLRVYTFNWETFSQYNW